MFNKENFSKIINAIVSNNYNNNIAEFARAVPFDRTYASKYLNKRLASAPPPRKLQKIANASKGLTTYNELMQICGYGQAIEKTSIEQGAIEYLEEIVKRQEPGWSIVEIALNYIKKLEGGDYMLDTQENSKNKNAAQHTKKEEILIE